MKNPESIPCYCISHVQPVVPERFYTDVVALGEYGRDLPCHVSKVDSFWDEARPVAFSSAGLAVIPKIVEASSTASVVGICSYRKIILPKAHAPINPLRFQVETLLSDVEGLSLADCLPPNLEHEFLVTGPVYFTDGIIGQYSKYHVLRDLLDYAALAIELGVLSQEEAKEFLMCPILIPGGCDVGFYPRQWLLETLGKLEILGREFVKRYGNRILGYDQFNRRALNFLGERLGSFFVLSELMRRYQGQITYNIGNRYPSGSSQLMDPSQTLTFIPPEIFGRMHVFVENYGTYSGGLAD
ncbi:MAG: hypothetical protein WCO60_02405 [Verrucomicrobiota bacterium]